MTKFDITPVTKPRMTQRDKWLRPPRTAVAKYWLYKDLLNIEAKKLGFVLPESDYWITFYIPMPASWSEKKKQKMNGRPHQQTPDKDNLEKAFLDALFDQDCRFWDGRVTKRWGRTGKIIIN